MSDKNVNSMAVFCDFENVALGARDARYPRFDIQSVLERLLLKGNIVVKKAYCDWERYKEYKAEMHGAAFEMVEIPHVGQSGKNSADIRMVVDALDLCYTKSHVDTFVIVTGDSDFSPLVSKLRENDKIVIGLGVKQSCSNLLIANCDEFIFYDDLVRKKTKKKKKPNKTDKKPGSKKDDETVIRVEEAFDLLLETVEDLFAERGDKKVWGSMVKQAIKRRQPGFDESYHGFKNFGQLLEAAAKRGIVTVQHDPESGGHIVNSFTLED